MPKTEAQLRAQKNYMNKFHRPYVRIPHEDFERMQAAAAELGESLNSFMLTAIMKRVEAVERNDKGAENDKP